MKIFRLTIWAMIVPWLLEGQLHAAPDGPFLFSYFVGNGEDGLHFAKSMDGLKWERIAEGRSFLRPELGENEKLMRDPCVLRGPDGLFHMVWTTGWHEKGIGIAHSKNLVDWSEQAWIPVMAHEPDAGNCWAPEITYDVEGDRYVIFWATTIPGRFPETEKTGDGGLNHRIYYVTTNDFNTYSDTRLLYQQGFNVIDSTIVHDGDRYVMFLKDETRHPAQKNIRVAYSQTATGPWGPPSRPITPDWVEGPSALFIDGYWYVYYDEYTRHRYGAVRSRDLRSWEEVSDRIEFPDGVRHGTAFRVTQDELDYLESHAPADE